MISGEYVEYCENINFILKAIHLLISSKRIGLNGCLLENIKEQNVEKSFYQESAFIEKAIEESKKMSDRQFMKEVISNV